MYRHVTADVSFTKREVANADSLAFSIYLNATMKLTLNKLWVDKSAVSNHLLVVAC